MAIHDIKAREWGNAAIASGLRYLVIGVMLVVNLATPSLQLTE